MTNMQDEIIFRDGFMLDNGTNDIDEKFLARVGYICDFGRDIGLSLDRFEIDSEMVYMEWRGTRGLVMKFYKWYSENMTSESEETRNDVLSHLYNKPGIGEG